VAVLLLIVSPAASHALMRAVWKVGVPQWRGAVGPRTNTGENPEERR